MNFLIACIGYLKHRSFDVRRGERSNLSVSNITTLKPTRAENVASLYVMNHTNHACLPTFFGVPFTSSVLRSITSFHSVCLSLSLFSTRSEESRLEKKKTIKTASSSGFFFPSFPFQILNSLFVGDGGGGKIESYEF